MICLALPSLTHIVPLGASAPRGPEVKEGGGVSVGRITELQPRISSPVNHGARQADHGTDESRGNTPEGSPKAGGLKTRPNRTAGGAVVLLGKRFPWRHREQLLSARKPRTCCRNFKAMRSRRLGKIGATKNLIQLKRNYRPIYQAAFHFGSTTRVKGKMETERMLPAGVIEPAWAEWA